MLTTITAIAGLFFGLTGFILSLLNYRRDRPKLRIQLDWDTCVVRDKHGRQAKLGRIYITNSGRRPIYVVSAGLVFFTLSDRGIWRTTVGAVRGRRLAEGDPPINLIVPDSIESARFLWQKHPQHWQYLRAFVCDSSGRQYFSGRTKRRPFWGLDDGNIRVEDAERTFSWGIDCHLEQHELEHALMQGDDWHIHELSDVLDLNRVRQEHSSWPSHLRGLPVTKKECDEFRLEE